MRREMTNTLVAAGIGLVLAILLVGLTVVSVAQLGPILYACFVVPLVVGVFYFSRRRQPSSTGIDPAIVFYVLTFVYVIVLAGAINLGFFSLR